MRGDSALKKLLSDYEFTTVCDVGSGRGDQAWRFQREGKLVTAVDTVQPRQEFTGKWIPGYLEMAFGQAREFDCIWCCHTLEHVADVGDFLRLLKDWTAPEGLLAIIVPPTKSRIVGGHLSLWNAGLLLYRLVLAGLDCSNAAVKTEGYDVSVIVRKQQVELFDLLPALTHDHGDLEALRHLFPPGLEWANDGFDGDIAELNW